MTYRRSKTFCPLPWIHMATRPNGDVRLCCTANASGAGNEDDKEVGLVKQNGVRMNLRDHSIEEVWNSDHMRQTRLQMLRGEVPASCKKCFEEESKGIESKRNWETRQWEERLDIDEIVSRTDENGYLPVDIPYFDLRLGNLCNLKCVMCSPHDSSSWIKDWKIQYPKYKDPHLKGDQQWDPSFDYSWYKRSDFLESMKAQVENIQELYFAGGEPLLIPEHFRLLEYMIEEDHAKNVVLRYNSNATEITDHLLNLWSHFKSVRFNFSIDGVGSRNEYIRHPSDWATIEANLRKLDDTPDNVTVNMACTVQLLNVMYLDELAEWKMDQGFKKINALPFGGGIINMHLVYLPSYMNVRVLPQNLKDQASERLRNFVHKMDNDKDFVESPWGKKRWLGLIDYMNGEDWSHKLNATVEYLTICDNTRGTDFTKIFPELEEINGPRHN